MIDHLLKNSLLKSELRPDLIIQIGSHLISTEVQGLITETMRENTEVSHVLLHTARPAERVDAGGTITHQVFSEVECFLPSLQSHLNSGGLNSFSVGSSLSPLILLGKAVAAKMPSIIHSASKKVTERNSRVWESSADDNAISLTEPQVMLAMSEALSESKPDKSSKLFLSNSMPVRDAEFFLYPTQSELTRAATKEKLRLSSVAVNRGASGIDGIISSATGFAEATTLPTTLLIGDLATLHDLNAFHSLSPVSQKSTKTPLPLTSVIVNNDGGGIFSFLPIAKHGNGVNFEEFWGTPTSSFSFGKGAEAFGLPFDDASDYGSFKAKYKQFLSLAEPSILEARVVDRNQNVQVHAAITKLTNELIGNIIESQQEDIMLTHKSELPAKVYETEELQQNPHASTKTLVLLHGWMGDKDEWDQTALSLIEDLPENWRILSIDLPGHGDSPLLYSTESQVMQSFIGHPEHAFSIDDIAESVIQSLKGTHGIETVDAIAGYSLGGRVALAMKKACCIEDQSFISDNTKLFLLGAFPGPFLPENSSATADVNANRRKSDSLLANDVLRTYHKLHLSSGLPAGRSTRAWNDFLSKWYGVNQLWGDFESRNPQAYSDMIITRVSSLQRRAPDFAYMLNICSSGMNTDQYWKYVNPEQTVYMAGHLDQKYSSIGKEWSDKSEGLVYHEVDGSGHSLLTEAPLGIATIIAETLTQKVDPHKEDLKQEKFNSLPTTDPKAPYLTQLSNSYTQTTPSIIDMEEFRIEIVDSRTGKGANGIGWNEQGKATNTLNERLGLIISISSSDGYFVGIGEISPLVGVHAESFEEAKEQIQQIQNAMNTKGFEAHPIDCERILALDGSLTKYIDNFVQDIEKGNKENTPETKLLSSVRSGVEMALLSLAAHAVRIPLPKALPMRSSKKTSMNPALLPMNGLVTRKEANNPMKDVSESNSNSISYPSMKVKVGHRSLEDDAINLIDASNGIGNNFVRADANRAWSKSDALNFVHTLKQMEPKINNTLEFIEEPIQKVEIEGKVWSLSGQVEALERWHDLTGIKYALDESLADVVLASDEDFDHTLDFIRETLTKTRGCAAFVLKPSLLGIERSMHLSRLAHGDLGIGAVFTSTFDSGVGLAHTAFLASLSDAQVSQGDLRLAHGLSTFTMLKGDTLTPAFESYANSDGLLNVASLGRAMHGLGLDEIRDFIYTSDGVETLEEQTMYSTDEQLLATSSATDEGREIIIHVSLPLPFSVEIACSRFTDLPQQPRWSPWINSVAYLGKGQTEWTLNVRGVEFRWKADSKLLDDPKGIMWESTSGLKNKGLVEFIKVSENSCLMRVKMSIITPRIIALAFKTSGEFVKDFVERKLLKWSLESFRDVVKADLALERGDAELGDALFGAVEGRSNAIEATLSYSGFDDKI